MPDFTPEEYRAAVEEKKKLLAPLFEPGISEETKYERAREIEEKISQKRLEWYRANKDNLEALNDPNSTGAVQKAVTILFGSYMDIENTSPAYPHIISNEFDVIDEITHAQVTSKGDCPYLDAMADLGATPEQSVWVCRNVLEKPCQDLIQEIDPELTFGRLYDMIRPVHTECIEYIFLWRQEWQDKIVSIIDSWKEAPAEA